MFIGPGHYDLTGKFISGKDPRHIVFPKGAIPKDKSGMGPGPGSYKPLESMGKQVLSTKHAATVLSHSLVLLTHHTHSLAYLFIQVPGFPKADRPTMVPPGTSDVGPGEYGPFRAACEPQVDSRKVTCGSIKFGTGYRKGTSTHS